MKLLIEKRRILLSILLFITLVFLFFMQYLGVNFSFDHFYPKDSEEYQYFQSYKERFGEPENFMVVVALKSDTEDIYNAEFLQRADSLFTHLSRIEGLDSSVIATQFEYVRRTPGGRIKTRPYLAFESDKAARKSQKRVLKDSVMLSAFITHKQDHVASLYFLKEDIADTPLRDEISGQFEEALEASGLTYVISGIPYIRTQYVRKIKSELFFFLFASFFLIWLVLYLSYRNFWGIIMPMIAVLMALLWTLGFIGMNHYHIDFITNLIIPIIFVVGVSDIIHLTTRYVHEIRQGKDQKTAIHATLKEIGLATFLTSATTAIGFSSLLVSRVIPIRYFGVFAAAGVMFAYIISIILVPNAFLWVSKESYLQHKAMGNAPFWDKMMLRIHELTEKYSRSIGAVTISILIACFMLIPYIPTNTYLLEDISKKDDVYKSMKFFERELFGMRPFKMGLHMKDGHKLSDREVLLELDKVNHYLESQDIFTPCVSMVSFIKAANSLYHFNKKRHAVIPDSQEEIDELISFAENSGGQDILSQLMTSDQKEGCLTSRMPDLGTDSMRVVHDLLHDFIQTECDTTLFSYQITGNAVLTERNFVYIRESLLLGLLIAFVVIGCIIGLQFRSWKMLLIGMVPNVIPLILIGGVMAIFQITLSPSTAIVFVVSFGIAVDDTIHFLTRYRLERLEGRDRETAVKNTLLGTGKAMVLTSLVLLGGFILLLTSTFGGSFNIGLFTGLTIVFALICDFILLPIMLKWIQH